MCLFNPTWYRTSFVGVVSGLFACYASSLHSQETSTRAPEVTTRALATLRDVGGVNSGVSISPDGRRIVFEVHQARPTRNDYLNQWIVLDVQTHASHVVVPHAGEPIMTANNDAEIIGLVDDSHHNFAVLTPVWAPDSRSFYYIKNADGRFQLRRSTLDGDDQLVRTPIGDVVGLSSLDPHRAVVTLRATSGAARDRTARERAEGLLFTGSEFWVGEGIPRFHPTRSDSTLEIDLSSGAMSPGRATPTVATVTHDTTAFGQPKLRSVEYPNGVLVLGAPLLSPDRSKAVWLGLTLSVDGGDQHFALFVSTIDGHDARRVSPLTAFDQDQPTSAVWAKDSRHVYFVLADHSAGPNSNVFVSDVGTAQATQLTHSQWLLDDCSFATELTKPLAACTVESFDRPPEIAVVDLVSGGITVLTNLNPKYNASPKARSEVLRWTTRYGDGALGVLTYPRTYRPGQAYPLVVTFFHVGGFLRGSNGDEYPIPVLAANGFFVLDLYGLTNPLKYENEDGGNVSFDEYMRPTESNLGGLQYVIDSLAMRGLVDSSRVGLCGLSAGSAFTAYAIAHSHRFRAAIIDHDIWDPFTVLYLWPSSVRDDARRMGLASPDAAGWKRLSTALNADSVTAALLINADDREYSEVIQSYWNLKDRGRPVELWVFNDEHHAKWQPAHRLTIYNRNVDWFNYWLRDVRDPDPAKRTQYARWDAMRAQRASGIDSFTPGAPGRSDGALHR